MPFKGTDRRLRTRFRVRVPFVLKNNGHQVRGITRNISLLGISATTDAPMPQVQPVQCVLELPAGTHPIVAQGTVIRCEELPQPNSDGSYEIGVFFKEFQSQGESTLTRFLDQKAHEEQAALKTGYLALQKKLADRRRRKKLEALRKKRRRLKRLRRRRLRLARDKRLAAQRRRTLLKRAVSSAARLKRPKRRT